MTRPPLVVAIDGPAGAGKSTTAREVARRLGLCWVDTGAMYRAVTLWLLRQGIPPVSGRRLTEALRTIPLELIPSEDGMRVVLDGEDVTDRIRAQDVTDAVSYVASLPEVRQALAGWQRALAERGNVVMEGRDIGTVVCPWAPVKVFLSASLEKRARRRAKEIAQRGGRRDDDAVRRDIQRRDEADSSRALAPLAPAADAVRIDTSDMTIEEQVDAVIRVVEARGYGDATRTGSGDT